MSVSDFIFIPVMIVFAAILIIGSVVLANRKRHQ